MKVPLSLSTRLHALLRPRDAEQLAAFMRYFTCNLTKKVNRLTGWSGTVFDRRFASIVISDEPEAMVSRFRYLLSNSVKEDLVMTPADWPGVESATPLCDGSMRLEGQWFDGRKAHRARLRGEEVDGVDDPRAGQRIDAKEAVEPLPRHRPLATPPIEPLPPFARDLTVEVVERVNRLAAVLRLTTHAPRLAHHDWHLPAGTYPAREGDDRG